jgi:sugar (glycoside-pentoside-hexuronide) transporter
MQPGLAYGEKLPIRVKAAYALGDHSLNLQMAAMSLLYLLFLTETVGLRPSLAGLVLLAGRAADALSDPLMGRISDRTRWVWGRRRPYFLIGALPFGLTFAALWVPLPYDDTTAVFLTYAAFYVMNSLSATVLAVPYMALLPELALGYDERTSANSYRQVAAVAGVLLAALCFRPLVDLFGGGREGWGWAGLALGLWLVMPWLAVYRVSWERPEPLREARIGFLHGMRMMGRHRAYRRLLGVYLAARVALDVVGAMFIFYVTYWLLRPGDFEISMGLMLVAGACALPLWLRLARRRDKRTIFKVGAAWWIAVQLLMFWLAPGQPAWMLFAIVVAAGAGYTICDMMPWSMLGDVIDADQLDVGERRDGIYTGFFTFVRKLGGATGVALAGLLLDLAGFQRSGPESEAAIWAIRILTTLVPACFLALAIVIAGGYSLSRARHAQILTHLERRSSGSSAP